MVKSTFDMLTRGFEFLRGISSAHENVSRCAFLLLHVTHQVFLMVYIRRKFYHNVCAIARSNHQGVADEFLHLPGRLVAVVSMQLRDTTSSRLNADAWFEVKIGSVKTAFFTSCSNMLMSVVS